MRILFAGDEHRYSEYALNETIKLAKNTWADVSILGIQAVSHSKDAARLVVWPADLPVGTALRHYRETFLSSWNRVDSPYEMQDVRYEWIPVKNGRWEETKVMRGSRKDFKVRLRIGNPGPETLEEAKEDGSDLIVLGCTKGESCVWELSRPVPQEVVNDANCSVLLVKEEQPVTRILACLDQGYISQESLEIINQMVTIHGAQLELVGLSQNGDMNKAVYTSLIEIGDYYSDREVEIKTRLTDVSDFEHFISREIRQDLLALWVGQKSLLSRFFSRDWVGRFVSKCQSSVLVMR
ncbi:MAG: universal stress protein [Desulfomonile tiedjei]|uniref:Universal stress protein n=1 Tax=Desulfomonile tiedjei TaxID=2358 RepID=A0A9D6V247_9BACT|nr:universal stress protein [Desulfomonile tiedjei]